MEVAAAEALKPSLRTEFIFPQAICDEIFCFNANNIVVGEDFSVDDLLDFSNGEFQLGKDFDVYEEEEDEEKDSTSGSSQERSEDDSNSNSTGAGGVGDSDSVFAGELSVPADDVADLEWVSHFVDDSLPELSLLYPVPSEQTRVWAEPKPRPGRAQNGSTIPRRPRTGKNRKPNARVWSFTVSPPSLCFSVLAGSVEFGEPTAKKQKKKAEAQIGAQFQRRCSHCQVQKTPQWRTGPLGPKTLCNACGVRFKSGRLFPEYRPACSPTFSGDIHSNSHRKVLEMRRRKEISEPQTGSDRPQLVPSF
ncbi:GATA transcription factor 7 [Vigna radiata var. radiata]|uniref:GATA transcription factor n=1 Tax=Vigna radiata var. radiata TaxID=3916 RepID=A0A1S3TFH7_VIGRR|nr:GATA transcription factor 7 [Vigna radiata var. radiata]XP_014492528.1 GATA transcription factor 7 [Vigna radiata var. radiata]XP_022633750.1 GATA transcription factor 7 [Vigna radiata var. radiata]